MSPNSRHKANIIGILVTTADDPSVQDALCATPAEVKLWKEAMDDELLTINDQRTWIEVKHCKGVIKPLSSQIVLKKKRNKHDQAKKFKAMVVAGGNELIYQLDYEKIYAPVADFIVCILILIIAFVLGWHKKHVDMKAAVLSGDID